MLLGIGRILEANQENTRRDKDTTEEEDVPEGLRLSCIPKTSNGMPDRGNAL